MCHWEKNLYETWWDRKESSIAKAGEQWLFTMTQSKFSGLPKTFSIPLLLDPLEYWFLSAGGPSTWVFSCWQISVLAILVQSLRTLLAALNLQQSVVAFTVITYYVKNIFFLYFTLANTLLENVTDSEVHPPFRILSGAVLPRTHLDAWAHLLSLVCTPTFMTLQLSLGPALSHYVPTPN